jgi:eukaryotic translation initiation factor 2C
MNRSFHKYDDFSAEVDLDKEEGRPRSSIEGNKFYIFCRRTRVVNLAVIDAWLHGKQSFDESILEALSK